MLNLPHRRPLFRCYTNWCFHKKPHNFIDGAVTDNLDEIKVIHGVGTGKLKQAIREHLKRHKNVESFREGKYGEGETGYRQPNCRQ